MWIKIAGLALLVTLVVIGTWSALVMYYVFALVAVPYIVLAIWGKYVPRAISERSRLRELAPAEVITVIAGSLLFGVSTATTISNGAWGILYGLVFGLYALAASAFLVTMQPYMLQRLEASPDPPELLPRTARFRRLREGAQRMAAAAHPHLVGVVRPSVSNTSIIITILLTCLAVLTTDAFNPYTWAAALTLALLIPITLLLERYFHGPSAVQASPLSPTVELSQQGTAGSTSAVDDYSRGATSLRAGQHRPADTVFTQRPAPSLTSFGMGLVLGWFTHRVLSHPRRGKTLE